MSTRPTDREATPLSKMTALRNVVKHTSRLIAALALAYVMTRWILVVFIDDEGVARGRMLLELIVFLPLIAIALTFSTTIPLRRDMLHINEVMRATERDLRDRNQAQDFARSVSIAFEMAEHEPDLFEVAGLALDDIDGVHAEILVADASRAHVDRVVATRDREPPGCGVTTPHSCPAVRGGRTLEFGDPNGLAACPRLRERQLDDGLVAVCVPIHVLGSPSAVLHTTRQGGDATPGELTAEIRRFEAIASRFGVRLGMIRAMEQTTLQAETDPLTGLLNRRATENCVRELRADDVPFSVAMVDLDHFKDLNDTYGHDTGDRALRLFARVLTSTMREGDIISRHGGEEFVLVLAGTDVQTASPVVHRLRERLAEALQGAQLPSFTASIGLVDSTQSYDFRDLVGLADRALLTAKTDGRDRVVIGDDEIRSCAIHAVVDLAEHPT